MFQDVRFAFRAFARQRAFFFMATLTVALGVALTTTIFSVADNLLYRPLPYPRAHQLCEVFGANRGDTASRVSGAVGDYLAWRESGVFSSLGVFRFPAPMALTGGQEARHVLAVEADDHLLPTLGVQPALGRAISAMDTVEGARAVLVISYGLWQREFGGDTSVVGRVIDAGNKPAEIVGVLPQDFLFPAAVFASTPQQIDIVRPLVVPASQKQDHNRRGYRAVGRLAPEVTMADAQARLDAVQSALKPLYRPSNVRPGAFDGVRVLPLQSSMVSRPARESVRFLLIAAFGVLLVAAANVANMLLARGAERGRELAVRAAIGASRGRLVRLLLVESIVLSTVGGALGFLAAKAAFAGVLSQVPQRLVALRTPQVDLRVAVFALAVSVAVGIVFGVLPAWKLSRAEFGAVVKQGSAAATRRASWGRDALVFAEVALAVMLVGAGALVLRSFANVLRVDVGMDAPRVLTLQVTPPARIAPAAAGERATFFRTVLESVESLPGVEAAALTDHILLQGGYMGSSLSFDGVESTKLYARGSGNNVSTVHVTPDYFRVMGMPLRGSPFPAGATSGTPVAITSERAGRFAGIDPLGRDVISLMKSDAAAAVRYRVIGVAPDVHEMGLDSEPLSVFYLPFDTTGRATLLVRATQPGALAGPVRQAIQSVDRTAVIDQVRTLDELVYRSLAERRFNAFLYGAFSLSALVLSAIGVFGVIAYTVSRRTREIGIRIALGATSDRVVRTVTQRTMFVLASGVAAGLAGLLALGRALRALVFNVQPNDPLTLGGATAVLIVAALAAAYIPARRAARVDPMIALRAE